MEQRKRGWKSRLKRTLKVIGLLALFGIVWLAYLIIRPPTLPPTPTELAYTFPHAEFESPDNAWNEYLDAALEHERVEQRMSDEENEAALDFKKADPAAWTPAQRRTAEVWLAARHPALDLVRAGAAKPYCIAAEADLFKPKPLLSQFRSLAIALRYQAVLNQQRGSLSGAVEPCLTAIEFSNDIAQHGALIDRLTGFAGQVIGLSQIQRLLEDGTLTDAAVLRQIMATATRVDAEDRGLVPTLRIEYRGSAWSSFMAAQSLSYMRERERFAVGEFGEQPGQIKSAVAWCAGRAFHGRFQDEIAQAYLTLIVEIEEPSRLLQHRGETLEIDWSRNWYVQMIRPVWESAVVKERLNRADRRLLALAAALRLYQVERRAFPQTLADLVPTYLLELPPDPFLPSQPLQGRRDRADFTVWSVATDGHDDGGAPALARNELSGQKTGDYVWRLKPAH